ncbi:MAG: SlyX family protein [Oleiphilaceae bacterium]|nr:SlyX family protein [Oleiphilaceae bacterium]
MQIKDSEWQKIIARIEELEIKAAYQDDTITALNDSLVRQELELQKLWDANRILKKQLDEVGSGADGMPNDSPPPHY